MVKIVQFIFERKVNYYETDKMGVVHHSNYIRYMEEARCAWLVSLKMPFEEFEKKQITIPVLGVTCNYKYHATYGDTIGYEMKDKKSGKTFLIGETKHCFTDINLKPINLKKYAPEFSEKFQNVI